jgi:hypothetical protein
MRENTGTMVSRRNALVTFGCLAGGVALLAGLPWREDEPEPLVLDELAARLVRLPAAERAAVAARVLQAEPDGDHVGAVVAAMGRSVRVRGEALVPVGGADRAATAMDARIREDFASGRIVLCDGWLLARTQADLLAAAAAARRREDAVLVGSAEAERAAGRGEGRGGGRGEGRAEVLAPGAERGYGALANPAEGRGTP